jgi:hypothetical protein
MAGHLADPALPDSDPVQASSATVTPQRWMCSVSSSSPAPSEPRAIATALASVRIGRQAVNSMIGRTR